MKIKIRRTSVWDDEKPCQEAYKEKYVSDNGNKYIGWFIDINSLDELLELKEKYGDIIITNNILNQDRLELEIYDTLRE